MMIMPPGHHAEVLAPRRQYKGRERYAVIFGVIAAAALAVVIVFSISKPEPSSKNGCVYASVGSTTGALTLQGCGAQAREICARVSQPGVYPKAELSALVPECRKAGVSTAPLSS